MGFWPLERRHPLNWDDERRAGPGVARPHSPPTKLPTAVRREPAGIVGILGEIMGEVLGVGRRGVRGIKEPKCSPILGATPAQAGAYLEISPLPQGRCCS